MKEPRRQQVPIDKVDLSHPLSGKEGVDPNHASRIRVQTLLDQHATLIQQTQFADTKAGGLVTLVGLLALKGPMPVAAMTMQDPVALAAAIMSGICILFCVLAVFPRYPAKGTRQNLSETDRFSWPALAAEHYDGEKYAEFMHVAEVSQIVHSIAHSNSSVSHILLRKYQMLRIAFLFGALDFAIIFGRMTGLV